LSAASVVRRGFHPKAPETVTLLETIGHSFLTGFGHAVGCRNVEEARSRLETVPLPFRGFGYEGAAMGYAILAGLVWSGRHLRTFLAGPGHPHIYMAYVGIGWACARLPRWRWRRILPNDQLLSWLVLDGYGFHQAYFHTRRYVHGQYQDRRNRWPYPGSDRYAARAVDQGIGRALWFVEGADVDRVADRIAGFPAPRRSDLFGGAGLAATYAGGADETELRRFWKLAGEHRPQVAQASAFAAEARVRAGLVTEHTALATDVFCGMPPAAAAAASRAVQAALPQPAALPAAGSAPVYEIWRERLARHFASLGRC
jgi:hypothetical protein